MCSKFFSLFFQNFQPRNDAPVRARSPKRPLWIRHKQLLTGLLLCTWLPRIKKDTLFIHSIIYSHGRMYEFPTFIFNVLLLLPHSEVHCAIWMSYIILFIKSKKARFCIQRKKPAVDVEIQIVYVLLRNNVVALRKTYFGCPKTFTYANEMIIFREFS